MRDADLRGDTAEVFLDVDLVDGADVLAHLDVVEALKSDWSPDLDPFKLIERDGYFYARGTSDDKAQAAAWVAILLQFKKEGYVPDRDIVLALTADEEGGCCNGARWLVQNHRDLVDVGLILNEGGFGYLRNGKPQSNVVEATQKVVVTFTVTAKNPGGHSSLPRPDNAIYQLAAGLYRFSSFAFPVEFNPVNKAYFEKTALVESPENAAAMRAIVKDPADAKALAVLSRDPLYNSTLRTTCVATMLKGGHATNALPQTAEATINCRMVPTSKPSIVRDAIVKALADTGLIVSEATNREPPAPSPLLPEVMGTIESITKEMWRNIPVMVTYHPSYLLRIPDGEGKAREYQAFVRDLTEIRRLAEAMGARIWGRARPEGGAETDGVGGDDGRSPVGRGRGELRHRVHRHQVQCQPPNRPPGWCPHHARPLPGCYRCHAVGGEFQSACGCLAGANRLMVHQGHTGHRSGRHRFGWQA